MSAVTHTHAAHFAQCCLRGDFEPKLNAIAKTLNRQWRLNVNLFQFGLDSTTANARS